MRWNDDYNEVIDDIVKLEKGGYWNIDKIMILYLIIK